MKRLKTSLSAGALAQSAFARLIALRASHKRTLKVLFDAASLAAAFVLAMALYSQSLAFASDWQVWGVLALVIATALIMFMQGGLYASLGVDRDVDILRVSGLGALVSALLLLLLSATGPVDLPLGAAVIYLSLAVCLTGGVRVAVRALFCDHQVRAKERVLIYGAGDAGRQLLAALRERGEHAPVGFLDDDPLLHGARIGGLEVFDPADIGHAAGLVRADAVFLALPSASRARRKGILDQLERYDLRIQTVPDIHDILSGRAAVSQISEVTAEDLLGRDPIAPDPELMGATIRGLTVMVTGAGGSIGSELCRQILSQAPARIVLLDQSEYGLYEIERALKARKAECEIIAKLGSVGDDARVATLLERYRVNTIFHCAAYKHVPLVEDNVIAAVRNNTLGTLALARQAVAAGVSAFILVSTDKAVRPASVMGATKRLAELICHALAASQTTTRFTVVRFGNVLDSSGSVMPLFRQQVGQGGPVTVTHPDVTRYFMTMSEAAQLVIQAGALSNGNGVYVLDMGEPVRVVDLAFRMVRLAGQRPFLKGSMAPGDIEIRFTGLRAGEKLHEELLIGEAAEPTRHPRILSETAIAPELSDMEALINRIAAACEAGDAPGVVALMSEPEIGYDPDALSGPGVVKLDPRPGARPAPASASPAQDNRPAQ
ncbi:polysaccharide biosynthesis protein [Alkalicaulis satelles]|uniref:Polysaccharide biosynthesis protein n=1 Tax=Alkalicaulis satelles TaxID=2609175 RepID=A0A5M6ZQX5_9PROT|nr:nucleoside-diphosphate sugar epimerase/dehydratase [Alkalicaulis satelles]KAA5804681.1 polysaccharide biosynthesis protein [Alkalicaulis satelles]